MCLPARPRIKKSHVEIASDLKVENGLNATCRFFVEEEKLSKFLVTMTLRHYFCGKLEKLLTRIFEHILANRYIHLDINHRNEPQFGGAL